MKTVITIENGTVTVQVDDQQSVTVSGTQEPDVATALASGILRTARDQEDRPAQPPVPKPPTSITRRVVLPPATPDVVCANCGKQFEKKGRGRRPRLCPTCRELKLKSPGAITRIEPERPRLKFSDLNDKNGGVPEGAVKVTEEEVAAARENISKGKGVEEVFTQARSFKPVDNRPPVQVFDGARFLDPWNCENCRFLHRLCGTHKFMTDSGKKPPISTQERG